MCGFLENDQCLHLGTPAIVKLFLLQTDPHQRREKLCGPHRKKFRDPCLRSSRLYSTIYSPVTSSKETHMTNTATHHQYIYHEMDVLVTWSALCPPGLRGDHRSLFCRDPARCQSPLIILIILTSLTSLRRTPVLAL